jgi:hypothetical protein
VLSGDKREAAPDQRCESLRSETSNCGRGFEIGEHGRNGIYRCHHRQMCGCPDRRRAALRHMVMRNGRVRGPRTVPSDHVTAPSRVKRGMRFNSSSIATVSSMRARFEPMQR